MYHWEKMAQWDRCQSGATGMDRCCCKQKIKGRKLYLDSQLTHTCSKLTIETLEKGMKYVQS